MTIYYVDAAAANDSGDGSIGSPKKYIGSGIGLLSSSGGDTLIIVSGTYSNTNDKIVSVPNGQPGAYNTIKSQTDYGVEITTGTPVALLHTNQYISIEGIIFNSQTQKVILGSHIKLLKCGFVGGEATDNKFTVHCGSNDYNDTQYILFEDCWSYGPGGRYNFMAYNSNYVIFRRCVARHDGEWTDTKGDPEAGICIYNSSHVEIQNCIVIDSNLTYHSWTAGYYIICNTASPNGTIDVRVRGCISINNTELWGFANDGDCSVQMNVFDDNLVLDSVYGMGNASSQCDIVSTLNRCTVIDVTNGFANWNDNQYDLTNSIILNASGYDFNSGLTRSYIDRYNITNPQSCTSNCNSYDPEASGLLYPVRIESSSVLKTLGSSGGQIGSEILKKWGTSGTLWGETGYNTLTNDDLWPFPNEEIIKTFMSDVSTRGFCANTVNPRTDTGFITLTSYIWEYLGNDIPEDVYNLEPPLSVVTCTITTQSGQTVYNATFNISGTASSTNGATITSVTCPGLSITGASNWSTTATLSEGVNVFEFTATDSNNETDVSSITVTYTPVSSGVETLTGVAIKGVILH